MTGFLDGLTIGSAPSSRSSGWLLVPRPMARSEAKMSTAATNARASISLPPLVSDRKPAAQGGAVAAGVGRGDDEVVGAVAKASCVERGRSELEQVRARLSPRVVPPERGH